MLTGPRLQLVTQDNVRAACKLTMQPGQEDLVAPVAWSLADAYTMPDIAWPRLIYDGNELAASSWPPSLPSSTTRCSTATYGG